MSDFATAVTAVEMAVKAFGLEGQISVEMDSEAETIVLNDVVAIHFETPLGSDVRNVVASSIDEDELTETLVGTDDVVEAVIEAVVHVIAEQARDVLCTIFEAVGDEVDLDD